MTDQLASGGISLQSKGADRVIPFGKYLLVDRIAVGGMAEVYTAKSFGVEGFEKILAIKRILPTMAEDQDFIQMFINEAKIAGQLTHANICPIYELGKIGESHYIAMEYVWGKDLLQIMNRFRKMRKQMPPSMAAWIVAKMCEGLDYAHRKKDRNGKPLAIIHRDVSPQNCLVSYEGQVKMIDFGIAKAASNTTKTQAGVLKGKFGYMSPEQVRGLPVDHRSDIFAVGTCLYEMLTTERLFVGESDFSTLEKVRNAQVPPLSLQVPDVPKELEEIVMKALSRDVDDRWQTAADMQEALQRFIARERPPFGTSKVAAWMRTAFAPEMAKEKVRIDAFAKIGPPAPPPPPARPSAPSHDDEPEELAGEATVMTASPYDSLVDGGAHEAAEIQEQATQIFFSAEEDEEATSAAKLSNLAPAAPPRAAPPQAVVQAPPRPVGLPPPSVRTFGPPGGPRSAAQQSTLPQGMPGVPAGAPVINAPQAAPPPPMQPQMQQMQQQMQQQAFANPPVNPHGQTMEGRPPFATAPEATPAFPAPPQPQAPGGFAQPTPVRGRTDTMQIEVPTEKKKSRGVLYAVLGVGGLGTLAAAAAALFFVFGRGPGVGTIEVRTVPAEAATAEVLLDGVARGNAPVRLDNVPVGPHTLVVRHPGFREETRPVTVNANGTSSLDVAMSPAAAVVAVAAAPVAAPAPAPVAQVPVAPVPEATAIAAVAAVDPAAAPAAPAEPLAAPAAAPAPAPAPVAAPAPAPVAAPAPAPVAAPAPAPTPAAAPARPAPTPAAAPARPAPTPAARPAPTPTPAPAAAARPTPRRAEPAPAPEPAPAAAPSRRPTRVTATPAPAAPARASAAGQGTLLIQTIPWARVIIDGRDTGRNTPVRDLRVSAGSHRIGLRTADGNTTEITVEVTPNEVTRVVRQL